jgi:hypothetical protein
LRKGKQSKKVVLATRINIMTAQPYVKIYNVREEQRLFFL